MAPQTLSIVVVSRSHRIGGPVDTVATAVAGIPTRHRIAHRMTDAHRVGLAYVRALGHVSDQGGPQHVQVIDAQGRRLAAWRVMPTLPGAMTGTHDGHPLAPSRSAAWRAAWARRDA